jgi:peptidoglycan/xylan/chitin deacetylase (PgdA/CDA1 family)
MKIIISHDIDHLTVSEHFSDLIIPKFILRSQIELIGGYISFKEFRFRFKTLFKNKLQNLEEIIAFDHEQGIPSTFFIGMSHGLGLSYTEIIAEQWCKKILSNGFDVGVHGIAYDNKQNMVQEYNRFKKLSGLEEFGIRMHYLRKNEKTIDLIGETGYLFDSGVFSFEPPVNYSGLWEFPLHIMDTYEFQKGKPWQNQTLENVKASTEEKIHNAIAKNLPYLNILMHDFYFSEGFSSCKQWYIWLTNRLKEDGYEFINFKTAIKELDSKTHT